MRDSGKASKGAMQSVIKAIDDYETIVTDELGRLYEDAQALSDIWQDDQFRRFMECLERMRTSVERELLSIDHARRSLIQKVGML